MIAKKSSGRTDVAEGISTLIDPKLILADDNTRFNLKQSRIDTLAQSITDEGGVIEPVEVEPLAEASSNGHKYRLTVGFYRLAAVNKLNAEGAGIHIPTIIHTNPNPLARLRRQLTENMERENQSPMDMAIAIRKLLDAGLNKVDVRNIFARPGGRKGGKMQPASNSFINMTLSFLGLSRKIQTAIHEGLVGVAAAYELTKLPADKQEAVLEKAQLIRQQQLEREEKEDEKILAADKKAAEAKEKQDKIVAEAEVANVKLNEAVAALEQKTEAAKDAHATAIGRHENAEAKKAAVTASKTAEQNRKIAEAEFDAAQADAKKALEHVTAAAARAAEKDAKLKEAKDAAPKGAAKQNKAVGQKDVRKAAAATGTPTSGAVMLNAKEMREAIKELNLPGENETVRAIGKAITDCFMGVTTPAEMRKALKKIVS